jgi:hypothetical protein
MNQRIKALAEQAGLKLDLLLETEQIYYITPQGLERFAELIVQECLEQKPVAWLATNTQRGGIAALFFLHREAAQFGDEIVPLYTAPR